MHRNDNIAKARERQQVTAEHNHRFHCEVKLPPLAGQLPEVFIASSTALVDNIADACNNLACHDYEAIQNKEQDEIADRITHEQLSVQLSGLHEVMDRHLSRYDEQWDELIQQGDSAQYLTLFATCIEETVIEFIGAVGADARKLEGRGTINTQSRQVHRARRHVIHEHTTTQCFGRSTMRLADQLTRQKAIKVCLAKNASSNTYSPTSQARSKEIERNLQVFGKLFLDCDPGHALFELTQQSTQPYYFFICKLSLLMKRLSMHLGRLNSSPSRDTGKCTTLAHVCYGLCLRSSKDAPLLP